MSASPQAAMRLISSYLKQRREEPRHQFLEQYKDPVLVVALGAAPEDDGAFRTQVLTKSQINRAGGGGSEEGSDVAVVPVTKRMADAFQAFIWVGRESRCDVPLPFDSVSKLQAQFVKKTNGEYELIDAGSTNGTFVNGTRLERNKGVPIKSGQKVRFGKVEALFLNPEAFWDELAKYI